MSIIKEFREFAMRGNVVDLAVGVIIGAAFGKIVSSLVADIIMPPLGLLIGGIDFKQFAVTLRDAQGDIPVVVKFFWTRRSDGRVMHRRATGRQGWPAFRTVRVIGSQVLNAIGYCYKS